MTLQRIVILLALLGLAGAAGWWVATHKREIVLEEDRIPKALASDPWTGSKHFLASMGFEVHETQNLDDILDKAEDEDVVILDLRGPSPERSQLTRLRYWIRRGGRLIVEDDGSEVFSRCILPAWGMRPRSESSSDAEETCEDIAPFDWKDTPPWKRHRTQHDDEEDEDDELASEDSDASDTSSILHQETSEAMDPPAMDDPDPDTARESIVAPVRMDTAWSTVFVSHPDSLSVRDSIRKAIDSTGNVQYRVSTYSRDTLLWSDHPPPRAFADPGGFALVGSLEEGTIVVVSSYSPFRYHWISGWDHASVLWRLTGSPAEPAGLWIAKRARIEGWLSMLAERLPVSLSLAVVALILGTWAAAVRFGPVLVPPGEEKTGIVDHAEGAGRWLWQFHGGRLRLLAAMQESARRKQLRTHPELAGAESKDLGKALEAQGLGDAKSIEEAFAPPHETDPKHFLSVAKTLWSLRRNQ